MSRDYWQKDKLTKAARLLTDAASNLHTEYPNSASHPDKSTLPAVESMLDAAIECIKQARPAK